MKHFGWMCLGWLIFNSAMIFIGIVWFCFIEWINKRKEKRAIQMVIRKPSGKDDQLGERTYFTCVSFKLDIMNEVMCGKLIDLIIKEIGMEKAHTPASYKYSTKGKGGKGFTYFQPITDSFIAVDYWQELQGGYLTVCSCKKYNSAGILKMMRKNKDIQILKIFADNVGIKEAF